MKNILFPTDFSAPAPEVFKYAIEMAHTFNARLVMMHAFGKPDLIVDPAVKLEERANLVADQLLEFVNKHIPADKRNAVTIDYVTRVGFAAEAILQTAIDENIQLIVIGMTGNTNALEAIFGSTSSAVITRAECPVLAIPAASVFSGINNLVYTTNFEFRDLEAINYVQQLSRAFKAPVHCLHIVESRESKSNAIKNMTILKETYKGHKYLRFDMVEGKFENSIEAFAQQKDADIIAMMSHKRNFISRLLDDSSVPEILGQIKTPLLLIKDNAFEIDEESWSWVQLASSIG